MNDVWQRKLADDRIVLMDGGTGSELARRGFRLSDLAWSGLASDSNQHLLTEIHADFIRAGAEVITTNTFGAARFVLGSAGHGSEFRAINERAVRAAFAAREATGADVAVAGSISCVPPGLDLGAYPDPDTEARDYRELAELLAELGVDLIALEMMQDDEHAVRACEAAAGVGLPVWLGFCCRLGEDGDSLVAFDYPELPLDVTLDALLHYEPAVVTVMHTPPEAIEPALAAIRSRWDGPVGAYPVLDTDAPDGGRTPPVLSPAGLAEHAARWVAAGARVLGGCCGASPQHIRALREVALGYGDGGRGDEPR